MALPLSMILPPIDWSLIEPKEKKEFDADIYLKQVREYRPDTTGLLLELVNIDMGPEFNYRAEPELQPRFADMVPEYEEEEELIDDDDDEVFS